MGSVSPVPKIFTRPDPDLHPGHRRTTVTPSRTVRSFIRSFNAEDASRSTQRTLRGAPEPSPPNEIRVRMPGRGRLGASRLGEFNEDEFHFEFQLAR
jgi:hypothetical protein